MKLVLASGNKGKLREFAEMMEDTPIVPYSELVEEMDIIEDGDTFADNALIKARAVYKGLTSDDMSARRADLSSAGLTPSINRVQGSGFRVQELPLDTIQEPRSSSQRDNDQSADIATPNKFGVPAGTTSTAGGLVPSASTASLRSDRIGSDPANDKQLSLASRISHVSSQHDKTQNTRPLTTPTNDYIVIADDSGISVPALGGEPGIYSARYAGDDANDKENLYKLIDTLKTRSIKRTPAYYTAAIAIVSRYGEYVVHGWMHGEVIDEARGDKGFGYDPMFIPYRGLTSDDMSAQRADLSSAGLTHLVEQGAGSKEQLAVSSEQLKGKTLGELDDDVKSAISHRAKALELAKPIIEMLHRR